VLRPSVVVSRFEALRGSALTRLVGRDEETDLLLRRWARAKGSIDEENRRPLPNRDAVSDLKRQKLRIKDEIFQLERH
jgi:hypothetical protein